MKLDIKEKIRQWLGDNDFEIGVFGWNPITHRIGFPERWYIMVKPEYSPQDGACTILVMTDFVYRMTLATPYQNNEWFIIDKEFYNTAEQLKNILKRFTIESIGMWDKM